MILKLNVIFVVHIYHCFEIDYHCDLGSLSNCPKIGGEGP